MEKLPVQETKTPTRTSPRKKLSDNLRNASTNGAKSATACLTYGSVIKTPKTTSKEVSLPPWMTKCDDMHCEGGAGQPHYHCNLATCFTKGLLQNKAAFTCIKRSKAVRHAQSHQSMGHKHPALEQTWYILKARTSVANQSTNTRRQTSFRTNIDEKNSTAGQEKPPSGSTGWRTRLHIGKLGETATCLESRIQQLHTTWKTGPPKSLRMPHDPGTSQPETGHTIQFNPSEDGGCIWYGLCTSTCGPVDVFGDSGIGCTVQWFELSHRGQWNGKPADFYELSDHIQPQLLEAMTDWGHLLHYDREHRLFVDIEESATEWNEIENAPGNVEQALRDYQQIAENTETAQATKEDLLVASAVFPTHVLHFVDRKGMPKNPTYCRKGAIGCQWRDIWRRPVANAPIMTMNGPVLTSQTRYRCYTHNMTIDASADEADDPDQDCCLSLEHYQLGYMRYESALLAQMHSIYMDALTMAACRQRLLDQWNSYALRLITVLKGNQANLALSTGRLVRATDTVLWALHEFIPSDKALTKAILAMYQELVLPRMLAYDEAVAAFDGQVIRTDGTFRSATAVRQRIPDTGSKSKEKYIDRKVAGAVLVAVGTEGLCLTQPRLVPWENKASIEKLMTYILGCRRRVLGSLSAPAAFTTDNIRQHHTVLWSAVWSVYPELRTAVGDRQQEKEEDTPVLMMQDIAHREWVFTDKIASPKTHGDYADYVSTMKDIFHQLRLPHNGHRETMTGYKDRIAEWKKNKRPGKQETLCVVQDRMKRGILEPETATRKDDEVTLYALSQLGNAAIVVFGESEPYIPRRVLARTVTRLGMDQQQKNILFPDHGYPDGETFLIHLRGGNLFYATPRSRARQCSIDEVARVLTKPQGTRGYTSRRRNTAKQNTLPHKQGGHTTTSAEDDEPPSDQGIWTDVKGISDNPLVADAIAGCAYPIVLRGLTNHRLIEGVNTDETIVEAVNRYLNSNVAQGTIGFDIANMRMCYQRLRWDASALQRILAGNTSRNRPLHTKARIVQSMAHRILAAPIPTHQWLFKLRRVQPPKRTTPEDLCGMGYTLQTEVLHWSQDEIILFFQSIARYNRAHTVIGTYPSVYAWIAKSEMKGARTQRAVRAFAERVYNAKKKTAHNIGHTLKTEEGVNPPSQSVDETNTAGVQPTNNAQQEPEPNTHQTAYELEFAQFVQDLHLHPCDYR